MSSLRGVRLEAADNGWILSFDGMAGPGTEVYLSLDEVFSRLLSYFEWRDERGEAARYGRVLVERKKADTE